MIQERELDDVVVREPANGSLVPAGDVRDLRRELAEAHAISTRTHNAVATLAASLKEVVQRQDKYERGLNLNSFVAYLVFTVLLGGGFYMLYRSHAGQLVNERDAAIRKRDEALSEAAAAKKDVLARDEAARKAADYWQLIKDGRRADAIARYPEIKGERLTPTEAAAFQDAVARSRTEIVDASFADGVEAERGEQWKRAAGEFKRALSYEEDGPRAGQMRYYYGIALVKLGDYVEGAKQLDLAIAAGAERTVGKDARFYLAVSLEQLRQLDRARIEYLKFADAHGENDPLYWRARHAANDIAQRTAKAP
jgi:hypothetical protein